MFTGYVGAGYWNVLLLPYENNFHATIQKMNRFVNHKAQTGLIRSISECNNIFQLESLRVLQKRLTLK